jgi:outer membrane protein TolC
MIRNSIIPIFFLVISLSGFSQEKVVNIGVLVDHFSDRYQEDRNLLLEEIDNVISDDFDIRVNFVLENSYDLTKARENYEFLDDKNQDIVLVFGVVNNLMIYRDLKELHTPTIIFGSINRDFVPVDMDRPNSGINNLNYLLTPLSYKEDLRDFKELFDYQNIAILVDSYEIELLPVDSVISDVIGELGGDYTIYPIDENSLNNLDLSNYDAVYVAAGGEMNKENYNKFIKDINSFNKPSFSAFGREDVVAGIMASNQTTGNYQLIFRRIALNIEAIIEDGKNPSELPVRMDYNKGLTLNFNTADKIGLGMKYNLVAETEFVGTFDELNANNKYDLVDVIDMTLSNNLSLKSAGKSVEIQGQELKSSWSNYYPDINASAVGAYTDPKLAEVSMGLNPEYRTKGSLQLNQTLYSQDLTTLIKVNKLLTKAEQSNYDRFALDAVRDISNVYFNCLVLKTNLLIQAKNLEVTRENLKIATENFESGYSGKTDLLRFTSEKAQNTQVLIESKNRLDESFYLMNQLLNQDIDTPIDVFDVSLDDGEFEKFYYKRFMDLLNEPKIRKDFVDFLVLEGFTNAPELKAIGYNKEAVERQKKLYGLGRIIPTVALQAQYNNNFNQWGVGSQTNLQIPSDYNVGLSLTLPIFNQNKKNINRRTASIQQEQLTFDQDNIKRSIEKDINDAVLQIINEIVNIELSAVSEATAKEGLELTQTSYTEGAVNIIQLIDAQRNYLQAQLDQSSAQYNFLIASLNLERYIGYFFLLHSLEENQSFFDRFNQYILEKQ